MEVDVGVVQAEAVPAVFEDAEDEAPASLGMERAVEEGAAFERFAVGRGVRGVLEDDREWVMPCGGPDRAADFLGILGLRGLEGDGGALGPGRGVVRLHLRLGLAQEMIGRELDAPAGRSRTVRVAGPRRDRAAAPREAEHSHAGGVLAADEVLVPAVLAERQQDGGIDDAGAVVGDGDGERTGFGGTGDGDADPGRAGPACVLQRLGEDIERPGGKGAGDASDGAVVHVSLRRWIDGRTGDGPLRPARARPTPGPARPRGGKRARERRG